MATLTNRMMCKGATVRLKKGKNGYTYSLPEHFFGAQYKVHGVYSDGELILLAANGDLLYARPDMIESEQNPW